MNSLSGPEQRIVETFMDETTIKICKYVYKYHKVNSQSDLGGQPALWDIDLCWLSWLVFGRPLDCLAHY